MRSVLSISVALVLALSACGQQGDEPADGTSEDAQEALGSYDIDPQSGEVRATHTDAAGVTTTMRAGERVEARLPEPFSLYPGATVTNTTRVEQGDGAFVTVEFTTSDEREKVVEFYRKQAHDAGIEPEVEVSAGATTTLGGENRQRQSSFALQVTRVSALTEGQVSIASGFD
ncbi:MAG: hypothetical protein KJO02_01630 [Erythrobacter sp.]|nr:hypothetical protein [Erythrobacter sp.]